MIGVLCRSDESPAAEELFQLFKTPWEWHREGQSYDVVLATEGDISEVEARLILVYRSETHAADAEANFSPCRRRQPAQVHYQGEQFPLYGGLLTFGPGVGRAVCTSGESEVAAVEADLGGRKIVRIGYDLFQEVAWLLTAGQPVQQAHIPTLDHHIRLLRELILGAGIALVEIAPAPAGSDFAVCLTHDIDFVGIRRHKFDHSMWGFLYRATAGAALNFVRRNISWSRLLSCWKAAAALPLVYLGWVKDFWMPFDWYLQLEKGLSATYFVIPFKHRSGEKVKGRGRRRRAVAYDVRDIAGWTERLQAEGCEIGVHGIDAWHSAEAGREELQAVAAVTGHSSPGVRMHWLLREEGTFRALEQAGYAYDSTVGYNETAGYRCGTGQVFRPPGAQSLLELPMQVQDGALFFPQRLNLSEAEAWQRCLALIENTKRFGGVLTVNWHDRSHGPERFWGDFYARLVQELKSRPVWFGTAGQVVKWFRQRRSVTFRRVAAGEDRGRVRLHYKGEAVSPPLLLRIHRPELRECATLTIGQETEFDLETLLRGDETPVGAMRHRADAVLALP